MVGSSVSDLTQWLPEEFTAKDFLINLDKKESAERYRQPIEKINWNEHFFVAINIKAEFFTLIFAAVFLLRYDIFFSKIILEKKHTIQSNSKA